MFVDDITKIKCKQTANLTIDGDSRRLSEWFFDDKSTVNVENCEAMLFGSKQLHDVFLLGEAFTSPKSCRFPGLHLYSCLKFRELMDYICLKLNKFCGLINRVHELYSRKCLLIF